MELKMNEYEKSISKLTTTLNQKDKENMKKDEQIQQLQSQLYLTQTEYDKQSAELAKTLQDQESIYQKSIQKYMDVNQSQQDYDKQYLKLAYTTQLQELQQLKTDLLLEKQENEKLNVIAQSLQNTIISKNEQSTYNAENSSDLHKLIRKQQLIITALAAPFDISSNEVKNLLLDNQTTLSQQQVDLINNTVNRGLYLLGMREQNEQEQQDPNTPWRQASFVGQPSKSEEQQVQSFIQYNQLVKMLQLAQEKNQTLIVENKALTEQVRQLNVLLTNAHVEHEKQAQLFTQTEKQHQNFVQTWHKQINQLKNMQQILSTITTKARNDYKKACYVLEAKGKQTEDRLKAIQQQNEYQTNQIKILTQALQELKNVQIIEDVQAFAKLINIQPEIISLKDIISQQLQARPQSDLLTYLEHEFNKFFSEIKKNNKVNDMLVNIILNLMMKQKTKFFSMDQFKKLVLDCGCTDKPGPIDRNAADTDQKNLLLYLQDEVNKYKQEINVLNQRIEYLSSEVEVNKNSLLTSEIQAQSVISTAIQESTNSKYLLFLELLCQKLIKWQNNELAKLEDQVAITMQQNEIQKQNMQQFEQLRKQLMIYCSQEKIEKLQQLVQKSRSIENQIDKLGDMTRQETQQVLDLEMIQQNLNQQIETLGEQRGEVNIEQQAPGISEDFENAVTQDIENNEKMLKNVQLLQEMVTSNRDIITNYIKSQREFNNQKMTSVQQAFDNIENEIRKTEAESQQIRRMYIQQSNKHQKRIECLEERVKQLDEQIIETEQTKTKELRDLKEKLQQDRNKVVTSLQEQIVQLQNVVKGQN